VALLSLWRPKAAPSRQARRLEFRSFSRLESLPPEPEWLWRGFLACGSLTMLAGHPFAGKSMLVGGLLRAMDEGDLFLGQPTIPGTALLVSEEDEGALRSRADTLDLLGLRGEYISRSSGVLDVGWPGLIERSARRALEAGHRLLVIDTFPGLAGLGDEQENDAGAIAERLLPLQVAAGKGLAVLFLHHMNSQGQPRGSKALRGVVDFSIRLFREAGSSRFRLESESRFPTATHSKLQGTLVKAPDGWFYEALGGGPSSGKGVAASGETDILLRRTLLAAERGGLTYGELDQLDGLSAHIAKKRLPAWHEQGKVGRQGAGTKTDPYRWFVKSSDESDSVRRALKKGDELHGITL
jgi:AAA domain